MEKFIIKCFVCSRRGLDAERICNFLVANVLERTDSPEEANYMVVVTCGLTRSRTNAAIVAISDFQKFKGKLVVYGCLPAMDPESVKSVYSEKTLFTQYIERLDEFFNLPVKFKDIPDANKAIEPLPYSWQDIKKLAVLKKVPLF